MSALRKRWKQRVWREKRTADKRDSNPLRVVRRQAELSRMAQGRIDYVPSYRDVIIDGIRVAAYYVGHRPKR